MSMSMPGSGRPTEPGLCAQSRGSAVPAGDVSVMPQPPPRRWPVSLWNRSATSTGSAAPPEAA